MGALTAQIAILFFVRQRIHIDIASPEEHEPSQRFMSFQE